MTAAAASVASAAAPLEVSFRGFTYRVRRLTIAPSVGSHAFEVVRTDRPLDGYMIHHDIRGVTECTCGDYVFRRADSGEMCKHGRALAEVGLIPSTRPRVLPVQPAES